MQKLFFFLALAATITFTNCGSDDDSPGSSNCLTEYNTDLGAANTAYSDAVIAYSNDPSPANCQTLRDRANDIIDVVDNYQGCSAIDATTYQQNLDDARDAVDNIMC